MKIFFSIATIYLVFFSITVTPARSQTQPYEGYTFIGASGAQVCLGRWIPSTDVALPGVCDGQIVNVPQLTAISSRQSAERLDQILGALSSIDQRLAVNNDQIRQLINATASTQDSIDQQVSQANEMLRETITKRFDALPGEILATDSFKKEITKLKEDILQEVDKRYPNRSKERQR
jgi:hypothetical protein